MPVNPSEAGQEILGRPVYADLAEAAARHPRPIEIVDVFRPSHEVRALAEQAIEIGARVLWCQLDVRRRGRGARPRRGADRRHGPVLQIEHARFLAGCARSASTPGS